MSDKIYVVGHKNPDTDTVVSAIVTSYFLNKRDNTSIYTPVVTGAINSETQFVFEKFNLTRPDIRLESTNHKLFLVDHNELSQTIDGAKHEDVVGFIDHHKLKFESSSPLDITIKPWGCTCTILYDLFMKENIEIPQELKGPMLCAILSDTVITRSPTTTQKDIDVIKTLSEDLKIEYKNLGLELFKAGAQVSHKTPLEIIQNDFKEFDINGKKVGVGQIETPDLKELDEKRRDILEAMEEMKKEMKYHSIILMLTDIIEEGTILLVVSEHVDIFATMFHTNIQFNTSDFIPGMMSRKKQVAPQLTEYL